MIDWWCYWWFIDHLIDVIDDLTRHSHVKKLKITSSWCRTKSKATIGLKNTASYIPWLYTTWGQMVASNMIHCVSFLLTTIISQASRTLWICVPIRMILVLVLNECFLQQAIENIPVMTLVEQLKRHVAKRSLQRSLNNQIL